MHDWHELARDALDRLGDEVSKQGFPTWLRVFDEPGEETGMRVEVRADPTGPLGWRAPDDCIAVGVVATGKARVASEASEAEGATGARCDLADRVDGAGGALALRMAFVIARDQEIGWWMELPDGSVHHDPPTAGRMLDVLSRCLAVPTSPPEQPASEIHSVAWLASVIDAGLASERRLTWSDVERLHPLARVLAGDLDVRVGLSADEDEEAQKELDGLLRIAASAWSWEEIRLQAAAGELEGFVEASLATWMDEGMFSRWMLSMIPTVDQLLDAARSLLVPSAARRLAHAVRHPSAQPARSGGSA